MAVNLDEWNQVSTLKALRQDFGDTPKGKQLRSLKLDEVVSVAQVRRTFTGIEQLAESLKEVGQQTPILVRPKNKDGVYVILQGERRWRAAQLAGLKRIDAVVVDNDVDHTERIFGQLTENIQRDDMRPLEIAEAINELLEAGLKGKDIAAKLGYQPSYVALYRDLLDLPELVRQLAEEESVRDAKTLQMLKKLYAVAPERADALIQAHLDSDRGITRATARKLLDACQEKPKTETTPVKPVADTVAPAEKPQEAKKTDKPEHKATTPAVSVEQPSDEKDAVMPEMESPLPAGARRLLLSQVTIKLSILDEEANDVLYGILVPNVISDDPSKVCVLSGGRYLFWPVSQVHIETVGESSDDDLAGW